MARTIDLTDKLGIGEKPKVIVGDLELEVNDSARNVMRVIDMVSGDMTPEKVMEACSLLFGKDGRKALEARDLPLSAFIAVLEAAVELVMGGGDEGNAATPATI